MTIKNVRYDFFNIFDNDFFCWKKWKQFISGEIFFGIVNMYDKK